MCSQEITPKMKMNISYLAKQGSKLAILYASPHFPFLKNISMITLILTLETKHNSPIFIFLWIFEQMQVLCAPQGFCNGTFPPPPSSTIQNPTQVEPQIVPQLFKTVVVKQDGGVSTSMLRWVRDFSNESQSAPWIFVLAAEKNPELLHGTGIFCVYLPIDLSRM